MNKNYRLCAFADEASADLDGQIKAMQRNGISMLEIRGVDGKNIADITADTAKYVRRRLDESGISVWSLGSPYGKTGIAEAFAPQLERFRRSIDTAALLGAKCIRLFSFYVSEEDAENCKNEVIDRLGSFCEAALSCGIIPCHENEKGIFGALPERCLQLFRALPDLSGVFDPANFVQCGADTVAAFDMLSAYIKYMHIKDSTAGGRIVEAGKGVGCIPQLLQKYTGDVLTLEPHLYEFGTLKTLERDGERSEVGQNYSTADEAFDAACNALKSLIK